MLSLQGSFCSFFSTALLSLSISTCFAFSGCIFSFSERRSVPRYQNYMINFLSEPAAAGVSGQSVEVNGVKPREKRIAHMNPCALHPRAHCRLDYPCTFQPVQNRVNVHFLPSNSPTTPLVCQPFDALFGQGLKRGIRQCICSL